MLGPADIKQFCITCVDVSLYLCVSKFHSMCVSMHVCVCVCVSARKQTNNSGLSINSKSKTIKHHQTTTTINFHNLLQSYIHTNLWHFLILSLLLSTFFMRVRIWLKGWAPVCGDKEVRAHDDHSIILWANVPTQGVMPAAKLDYMITSVSNLLTAYKRNGVAIILHCNRGGDPARTQIILLGDCAKQNPKTYLLFCFSQNLTKYLLVWTLIKV